MMYKLNILLLGLVLLSGCEVSTTENSNDSSESFEDAEITQCEINSSVGLPTANIDQQLCREGYVVGYSHSLNRAAYVQYYASFETVSGYIPREYVYYYDEEVEEAHQVLDEDYIGTGYDRGHLAPYATMDFSETSAWESNLMTNITPMTPELNRGVWAQAEQAVRDLTYGSSVVVVVGSIDYETTDIIGKTFAPAAYYMAVLAADTNTMYGIVADNSSEANYSFVTIDEIEALLNYDLFTGIASEDELETQYNELPLN